MSTRGAQRVFQYLEIFNIEAVLICYPLPLHPGPATHGPTMPRSRLSNSSMSPEPSFLLLQKDNYHVVPTANQGILRMRAYS